MFVGEVLWDVAVKKDGSSVRIHEYSGEDVYCPECEERMIAVRGRINQHHYRHDNESNCSEESAKHWSKKYEIADALEGIGLVEVEKGTKIGNYVADVLFEGEWAFEAVVSNPPSEEKLRDLRENLVVLDFRDVTTWSQDGNPIRAQFYDYEDQSFKGIVSSLGRSIVSGETVDVCSVCRQVKGCNSRIKSDGRCLSCDMDYYSEVQRIAAEEDYERSKKEQEEEKEAQRKRDKEASEKKTAEKLQEQLAKRQHYDQEGVYGSREHCEPGCKYCQDEKKVLEKAELYCENMKKSSYPSHQYTSDLRLFNTILKSAREKDESVSNFLKEPKNLRKFFIDFEDFSQGANQFVTDVIQYCRTTCKHMGPRGGRCKQIVQDYGRYCELHR